VRKSILHKIDNGLISGILLASMPKSGSSYTTSMLAKVDNIRIENIVSGIMDSAQIDTGMLATALSQNKHSSFIAQSHIVCSDFPLELIEKKYLVPLVLTRNLPDTVISLIDHQVASGVKVSNIEQKCEYFIQIMVPWLLTFFASWVKYPNFKNVWIRYEDLSENNQKYFNKVTATLGVEDVIVKRPVQKKYHSPSDFVANHHFNRGINNRGFKIMSARQIELIKKLIILSEIPHQFSEYLLTGIWETGHKDL
jgi:hypothetical protein